MNRDFTRFQTLPVVEVPLHITSSVVGTRSTRVPIFCRGIRDAGGTRPYPLQGENQGEAKTFRQPESAQQPNFVRP